MPFAHKHILGIEQLSREDIIQILDTAESFKEINNREIKKVPTLRGQTIINLFFEASTRTRTSFEIAGKRLSADTVNIAGSSSSVVKGETLEDTAQNLEAMLPDIIVMRHSASGAPHYLAERLNCSIINAGDGAHEHPSQACSIFSPCAKSWGDSKGSRWRSSVTLPTAGSPAPISMP